MSHVDDRIREAARDRDLQELRYLARLERHDFDHFLRTDARIDLTPFERELAEDAYRQVLA